jgi:homoserine dehydrogenase
MSALANAQTARTGVALAVYGLGLVGTALLRRIARAGTRIDAPALHVAQVINTRGARLLKPHEDWHAAAQSLRIGTPTRQDEVITPTPNAVIVDATASDAVAAAHPRWLRAGHVVVTANKLGLGGPTERARAIAALGEHRYGDSATVGAGLPVLDALRRLRHSGERIIEIAGVLSGSLAWLLDNDDGEALALRLQRARELGYTEPDPRIDLSGEDVRRKLSILARVAGFDAAAERVAVAPLLALPAHAPLERDRLMRAATPLDAAMRTARARGQVLRYVARVDAQGARIGLETLERDDPLASGRGCENVITVRSERYDDAPLTLRGPGAGADRTAAALLDDILRLAQASPSRMTFDPGAHNAMLR